MSKKEVIAAGLVLIMLFCLLLQGISYLVSAGKLSPKQERFNHFLENIYCLCLFGIGILVVMIAIVHDQTP
ncbi:hypothetical protein M3M39_06005 [Fructilactobacillus hinvesii]|uniref:Uncharacterized protein n=1 Tax=Fructilactobacillus hinvesii TaxID=2940300 RepID=A0ABY5BTM8_9LACO|nr:hypothetical protein [Fructilactobacillus hinvesii]USS87661.1 hypothetical protein M3M39_06005 [Fructilactobacillus hinvesii]